MHPRKTTIGKRGQLKPSRWKTATIIILLLAVPPGCVCFGHVFRGVHAMYVCLLYPHVWDVVVARYFSHPADDDPDALDRTYQYVVMTCVCRTCVNRSNPANMC